MNSKQLATYALQSSGVYADILQSEIIRNLAQACCARWLEIQDNPEKALGTFFGAMEIIRANEYVPSPKVK